MSFLQKCLKMYVIYVSVDGMPIPNDNIHRGSNKPLASSLYVSDVG